MRFFSLSSPEVASLMLARRSITSSLVTLFHGRAMIESNRCAMVKVSRRRRHPSTADRTRQRPPRLPRAGGPRRLSAQPSISWSRSSPSPKSSNRPSAARRRKSAPPPMDCNPRLEAQPSQTSSSLISGSNRSRLGGARRAWRAPRRASVPMVPSWRRRSCGLPVGDVLFVALRSSSISGDSETIAGIWYLMLRWKRVHSSSSLSPTTLALLARAFRRTRRRHLVEPGTRSRG